APDAQPTLGRVELPPLTPHIDARRRAAQAAASAASAAAASSSPTAPGPQRAPSPTSSIATPPAAPATPAVPRPATAAVVGPTGTAFALSTRPLRTRAESEQIAAAMRALLPAASALPLTVEVLAVGDDWRVVGWPYAGRDAAERARALLATRGIRVRVVDF
ncbi:MAG: hypothetical protein LH480_08435, partial [Rubrivivax sp.]|nr:hypothetical protein [Rubrivivax sp.]